MSKQTFYITTPIYYPNGEPHLGHVYTTLAADTVARYKRLTGKQTWFLTGTDEHGIKMVKTAGEKGITPGALADEMAGKFKAAFEELGVSNDDFIRTTQERHKHAAREIVRRMEAAGDIYLGGYEGWYDEGQEEFVTETEAKANEYKSAISGRPLTKYVEPTYFFRLTKYVPRVLEYIEKHPDFIRPESKRNEVVSKLKMGVEDLSISRATLKWGIEMPNDPGHVLYVWIDALSNYISALGYAGQAGENEDKFKKFWPVDVHLIGREILWFHAVYWPAMLMSLGLPLPGSIFAHGWWTSDGKKMSKTMGNFIDLAKVQSVCKTHSTDALRYYLLRAAPFGSDLDWSDASFNTSYAELGNVLGNCLNRVLNMIGKYRGGKVPELVVTEEMDKALLAQGDALAGALEVAYGKMELQQAVLLPVELARATNVYIDVTRPFSLAKDPAQAARLDTVLALSARSIYVALVGLLPVLPEKATAGLLQMNVDPAGKTLEQLMQAGLGAGHVLGTASVLFPRVEAAAPGA